MTSVNPPARPAVAPSAGIDGGSNDAAPARFAALLGQAMDGSARARDASPSQAAQVHDAHDVHDGAEPERPAAAPPRKASRSAAPRRAPQAEPAHDAAKAADIAKAVRAGADAPAADAAAAATDTAKRDAPADSAALLPPQPLPTPPAQAAALPAAAQRQDNGAPAHGAAEASAGAKAPLPTLPIPHTASPAPADGSVRPVPVEPPAAAQGFDKPVPSAVEGLGPNALPRSIVNPQAGERPDAVAPAPMPLPALAAPRAQAAPMQARIDAAIDSPAFAPALSARVRWLVEGGVQQAQLTLNPAETGPLWVRIALDGQQARIDFSAPWATTRAAIESSLPVLAAALQADGLTLSGGGVFDDARQPRQDARAGTPFAAPRTPDAPAADGGTDDALARATPVLARARGLIDLLA